MESFQIRQFLQKRKQQQQQQQQQQPNILKALAASNHNSINVAATTSGVGVIRGTANAATTITSPRAFENSVPVLSISAPAASAAANSHATSASAHPSSESLSCIFGCTSNETELCRFPINDQNSCNNWLRIFRVSSECVNASGGIAKLRVCFKHFQSKKQMAKTRIKTTPTRMQKDALMASASAALVGTDEAKKRRISQPPAVKEHLNTTPTIIVPAPKRTNSICSAVSSVSHASDIHCIYSDNENPPMSPPVAPMPANGNTLKTFNSLLSQPAALKNHKLYVITEKCEDSGADPASGANGGQKRKMYLIMEEDAVAAAGTAQNGVGTAIASAMGVEPLDAQKYMKTENGAQKKLTLFADKSDGEFTQKFEKILPEILNRIQAKDVTAVAKPHQQLPQQQQQHYHQQQHQPPPPIQLQPQPQPLQNGGFIKAMLKEEHIDSNERLPITLPPKKNRTKIITTPYVVPINTHAHAHGHGHAHTHINQFNASKPNLNINSTSNITNGATSAYNGNIHYQHAHVKQTSAATPVIVSAATLLSGAKKLNGDVSIMKVQSPAPAQPQHVPQKNINLSTDFLFLMKMLPKLESIPEPHKNHVKDCIEKIVSQNASIFDQK